MRNTNCTVAWIDVYVLEIALLSLKDCFHKNDLYLWVKPRENNSVLETLWFSAVLSSTSPICKPSCSVTTPSAFFKLSFFIFPIYFAIYPKSNLIHRCFTSSCFKKSVGKEFGMTTYRTLSCCDFGVLFEDEEDFIEEVSYLFHLNILQIQIPQKRSHNKNVGDVTLRGIEK